MQEDMQDERQKNNEGLTIPYIEEVKGYQRARQKVRSFTSSSTKAAALMLTAAIVSLIIANTDAYEGFESFRSFEIGLSLGNISMGMSIVEIVNDILMAIFFLTIGLEIKHQMIAGELTNIRQALLPMIAACGGVLVPIVIYTFFNASNPATSHGWGVPTATDIAFALGIMALLGDRVPIGIKVFLTTLAVADDIVAILIIALFYGQSVELFWLAAVGLVMIVLIGMNRKHIFSPVPYILVGIVLWYCVYRSGVHATIAGVLLAFTIPTGSQIKIESFVPWSRTKLEAAQGSLLSDTPLLGRSDYMSITSEISEVSREASPPAARLESKLSPWVNFLILPLFALTNANIRIVGGGLGDIWMDPALYGVFFGLVLGKPIGIMLLSFITVKLKIASLPNKTSWLHMLGAGILGGVGFTMAIFVANLAFTDPAVTATAKLAILLASATAGITGFIFLWIQAKREAKAGSLKSV